MLKFMNLARQFPAYYVSLLDRQLESFLNDKEMPIGDDVIYETNEGKSAWKEARAFLQNQHTLPPLELHPGLAQAASDHAQDLAHHAIFGHTGSDKSTFSERILRYCKKGQGAMAEIIGADFVMAGRNNAELTVLGLIVDDGVVDRGHRKTIFNPEYRFVGYKSQLQNDKLISVFNLTENRLQLRGQSRLYEGTATAPNFKGALNANASQITKNEHFSKTESNAYQKDFNLRINVERPPFEEMGKNLANSRSPSKSSAGKNEAKGKKVSEKKENTRIFYEEGCKVVEKLTMIYYSDGTVEENIEKHTVYT
jgi:hypothetical protein